MSIRGRKLCPKMFLQANHTILGFDSTISDKQVWDNVLVGLYICSCSQENGIPANP